MEMRPGGRRRAGGRGQSDPADDRRGIAVDEARDSVGEDGVGRAVDLGLIVGPHDQGARDTERVPLTSVIA